MRSLTKPRATCKNGLFVLAALSASAIDARSSEHEKVRACVAQAGSLAGMALCERRYADALSARTKRLEGSIRSRLAPSQRERFDRSVRAWRQFLDEERKLLEITMAQRPDGLGPGLLPGAINELREQRIGQLEVHLRSLPIR